MIKVHLILANDFDVSEVAFDYGEQWEIGIFVPE